MSSNEIEIKNYRHIGKGALYATFSVATRGTEIHNCRVVQPPDGKPWYFTGPQSEYEKDGQKKYFDLVRFSEGFKAKVRAALEAFWAAQQQQQRGA